MTKHKTDRAKDPVIASLDFEGHQYELTKAGRVFVLYATGNYQRQGVIGPKTECKRLMWRDSPRRRAIIAEFGLRAAQ